MLAVFQFQLLKHLGGWVGAMELRRKEGRSDLEAAIF
jgi:hypothetical protein